MTPDQILAEIREANLSYLMLAQSLVRHDREQALFRLGINEETATLLSSMTSAQMMKIATGNQLLCRFRMDDDVAAPPAARCTSRRTRATTGRLSASTSRRFCPSRSKRSHDPSGSPLSPAIYRKG